jgi:hypothetical protein
MIGRTVNNLPIHSIDSNAKNQVCIYSNVIPKEQSFCSQLIAMHSIRSRVNKILSP